MASKAKERRDELEVELMGVYCDLMAELEVKPIKKRVITKHMVRLEKAWAQLEKCHAEYCRLNKVTAVDSMEYIKAQGKYKRDGLSVANEALGIDEEAEDKVLMGKVEEEMFQLKVDVEGSVGAVKGLAAASLSAEQHAQTMEILAEGELKLKKYMECNGQLVEMLVGEDRTAKVKAAQEFYQTNSTKFMELRSSVVKLTPVKEEPVLVRSNVGAGNTVVTDAVVKREPVKIKAMECPKWDGRYRTFVRFKKLWDENIGPRHEDSALHYMLCESLPKNILENISTLSNSAEDIWTYLEDKFGRPEIVAREVMAELMSLDHRKLGNSFMGKFCTMLLDTHSLLASLNELDWLVTNRTVADLEDKLPPGERIEWAKQMSTVAGDTRYEKFKNFLVGRKGVLENVELMGSKVVHGSNKGAACTYCGKNGHSEDRCYSKRRDNHNKDSGRYFPHGKGGCAICGGMDHWKNECPERGSYKDQRSNGNYKNNNIGGKRNSSSSISVDIGSNTLRALECLRCKGAKKLTHCPGCKQTFNITHCLLHCESFMVLSVKDRAEVVKGAQACAICLHLSHTADKCYNRSKDSYICGVNGCQSHHHPCLHGSRDTYVTGVNVLLRQQTQAVTVDCRDALGPTGRGQFVHNSYGNGKSGKGGNETVGSRFRKAELEEVLAELERPLLHGDKVLMSMMRIGVIYGKQGMLTDTLSFFDDGSNCSVILNKLAKRLGLYGVDVTLELGTVNAKTTIQTKLYCLELLDQEGARHLIKAFGLDSISGPLPAIDLNGVKNMFSQKVKDNWIKLERPTGEVELLIGNEMAHLHPVHFETRGSLVVKQSIFGGGWLLNGGHDRIVCGPVEFSSSVQVIRCGFYRSNKISVTYTQNVSFNTAEEFLHSKEDKDFMWAEGLGCEPPKRCISCRGCTECGFRGTHMSQKEALELRMMEENIVFDENIGKWRIQYPFLQDPRILKNNYKRVLHMMEHLERRLSKLGQTQAANEVFQKMVDIGALEEISSTELKMWSGPIHYLPIQGVFKASSTTTPVRLVTNSSLADPETGLSLNSILAKGPMYLNDMWEILVRFRSQEVAIIGDITKAYYQMYTGPMEYHCRRVLWRYGEIGTPWRIFGFRVVSMGDTPAANLMEITKRKTAERGAYIDEMAAKKIKTDSFVDDISSGGTRAECERFLGVRDQHTLACNGTMQQILGCGGFSLKAMVMSGEPNGDSLEKLGGSVLGLGWSSQNDMFMEKFRVNVSQYKRGEPTEPDLTVDTLDKLASAVITKRVVHRVVSSQYSPLGISCPLLVIMKIHRKELYKLGLDWDTPLTGDLRKTWITYFEMLVRADHVKFCRATKPENTVGKCLLVCYWDGADPAFGIAIYVRWVLKNGKVVVNLVASKARVAPMFGVSTARMELCGATLVTRVALRIVHAMRDNPPGRVIFLGDSETILASRERDKGFFGEYFGNRIGEQYDNVERMEALVNFDVETSWYHVASKDNAADKTTRMHSVPKDLELGSDWLHGPAYLKQPIESWPINRNFAERKSGIQLPLKEIRKPYKEIFDSADTHLIVSATDSKLTVEGPGDIENWVLKHFDYGMKTNNWEKLLKTTGYLFRWFALMHLKNQPVGMVTWDLAVTFWMRVAMPATHRAAEQGRLKHLSPMKHGKYSDLLVVVGRAEQGLKSLFQKDYLPIIMSTTRTAWLIMQWAHSTDHAGVDVTYHTSMQYAWIVGGRALARGIVKSCVRCRFLRKKLLDQQMSVLPAHLAIPCPVFSYVAVDLCGPFLCKREGAAKVTRRNPGTMKVWAALFVCLQVKAVKIYLVGGLHTEDFLLAWDQFVADHGQPLEAYSDRGTNIVAAAREGGDTSPCYDWDQISQVGKNKTVWKFHPAGSQFRNGAVEIFVKKFKKTLAHKFSNALMFLLELETSFKVVSSILNSRPIYARWGPRGGNDPDFLSPLTPNMLLTGRANTELPLRHYDLSDKPLLRLRYVEDCISQWWHQFISQNFSSLVPRQKWFLERRNMQVGDIVLVQYQGKCAPATYRLAIVVWVQVDADGLVRTVEVEYTILSESDGAERFNYKGAVRKRLRVAVQRLVLILPVEEQSASLDRGQSHSLLDNSLGGGKAGVNPVPLDEGYRLSVVEKDYLVGCELIGGRSNYTSMKDCLKQCFRLSDKLKAKDFEKLIYKVNCEKFNWRTHY